MKVYTLQLRRASFLAAVLLLVLGGSLLLRTGATPSGAATKVGTLSAPERADHKSPSDQVQAQTREIRDVQAAAQPAGPAAESLSSTLGAAVNTPSASATAAAPYRVSAAELLDYQRRLANDPNLATLADELAASARAGDADAAATLVDLLSACLRVVAELPPAKGGSEPGLAGRCAALMSGPADAALDTLYRRLDRARELAARMGDPLAGFDVDLQNASSVGAISGDNIDVAGALLARRMLEQGRLADWWRLATGQGRLGLHHDARAWLLALCQLGYPCSTPDLSMQMNCALAPAACTASDPVAWVRAVSSARTWRRLQTQRDTIVALLTRGDFDPLIRQPGGGG